ncbi:hypothetical protein F7725_002936 [Dissostichus mawsoni]|uniref:Uncharacterized protein n=1 Tax=Dissostichus mawsoni TaxID=36200 RepID=A0A7J5YBY6_DISMA|nr:hypothetical protein F7725_002936 [Dissostichus mawsoni]
MAKNVYHVEPGELFGSAAVQVLERTVQASQTRQQFSALRRDMPPPVGLEVLRLPPEAAPIHRLTPVSAMGLSVPRGGRPATVLYHKCKGEPPMQPHLKLFPRTLMGDRRRSFKADWYKIHPWLEYSKMSDSAHCYACRHFSPPNSTDTVSKIGRRQHTKRGDLQSMPNLSGTRTQ